MENQIIATGPNQETFQEEIILTPRAIEEIKSIMQKNNIPSTHGLRVGIKGGGCSGFTYVLAYDENSKDGDRILYFDNLKVFVDPKSMFFVSGTTLDFSDGLTGKGFVFNNPQATKTCGCGSSFGV